MARALTRTTATAAAVLALALVAGCGGDDAPEADATASSSPTGPDQSTVDALEAGAAYLNAEAAFDRAYEDAFTASGDAAAANDVDGVIAQYRLMRDALFAFDGSIRKVDLDEHAAERDALLTAIGAEIATIDRITQGEHDAALIDQVSDEHQDVVDAKVALSKAVG